MFGKSIHLNYFWTADDLYFGGTSYILFVKVVIFFFKIPQFLESITRVTRIWNYTFHFTDVIITFLH